MRSILPIYFFLCALFAQKASAQSEPQPSELSPLFFAKDAEQLATRLAKSYKQSEDVPFSLINEIEGVLWAIAQSDMHQAKAVTEQFQIHTAHLIDPYGFTFTVEDTAAWANRFIHTRSVQDLPFAEMLEAYPHLSVVFEQQNAGFFQFRMHSSLPMNMDFFSVQFSSLKEIFWVELPKFELQGNDIQMRRMSGGWRVYYVLREVENYPKDYEYRWEFWVSDQGEVKFEGEYKRLEHDLPPDYQTASGIHTQSPKRR